MENMIILLISVLIVLVYIMIRLVDKVHENDLYIKAINDDRKRMHNEVNNLTLQNDNLMTVIEVLDKRIDEMKDK